MFKGIIKFYCENSTKKIKSVSKLQCYLILEAGLYIYTYRPSNYSPLKGERFTHLQISAFRRVRLFKVNLKICTPVLSKERALMMMIKNFRSP